MGILLAFFAGWATASRAGSESHDEVVAALKAVRDSEEVADLVRALNSHVGFALRELGNRLLDAGDSRPGTFPDVLARVRDLVTPVSGKSPAS
ncbi:MAG TPA: hypothetical protein VNC22_05695 [Sporichthya sp.]|jgi:hypothetical protein|nr:hypothetical protein [Sporichthya sp.]